MEALVPDAATMHTLQVEEGEDEDEEKDRGRIKRRPSVAQTGARLMESASMLRKVTLQERVTKVWNHSHYLQFLLICLASCSHA